MEASEILETYGSRFRKELEARLLLMEIKTIFATSTAQEIERTIDRQGDIIAMDMILTKLPMRTGWVNVFYEALNGREINKPKLAELFKPFINTVNSFEEEKKKEEKEEKEVKEEEKEEKVKEEEKEEKEEIIYSLSTHLKDIPYLQALKDFYSGEPPNWDDFITKYSVQPALTFGDLMDYLYIHNKQAYQQAKREVKIDHTLIRQATTDVETTSLESVDEPVATGFTIKPVSEAKEITTGEFNSKNMVPSSDFSKNDKQPYLPPLCEATYLQEKALKDITQNVTNKNATISVSTNCIRQIPDSVNNNNSTVSLPSITKIDDLKMDSIKKGFSEDEFKMSVSDAKSSERDMPDEKTNREEFLEVDIAKEEIPQATINKIEVLESVDGIEDSSDTDTSEEVLETIIPKRDILQTNVRKMELPEPNANKKVNIIERRVPEDHIPERKVWKNQVPEREVTEAENDKQKIPKDNFSKMEVLESVDNSREGLQAGINKIEVLEIVDNSRGVQEADIRNRESTEADAIEHQALKAEECNKIEFAEVNAAKEAEESLQDEVSLPQGTHQEKFLYLPQLSILLLAMVLSFSFGYYCRSR